MNQAGLELDKDKYEEAQATFEKAYSLAESLNLRNERATCLDGLARLSWSNKDYDLAAKGFSSALELFHQANNREGEASTLLTLGELYVDRNQIAGAEECFSKALVIYEQLHALSDQLRCRLKLSVVATTRGDYESAFGYLNQVLESYHKKPSFVVRSRDAFKNFRASSVFRP